MSEGTQKTMNEKIATGQAMNLAVADAISAGKQTDTIYILTRFVTYYELGEVLQGLPLTEIKEIVKKGK